MHSLSCLAFKTAQITHKGLHGFSKPLHFLAESSANVCSFEIQQRGAPLEIRQKCWQPANKTPESVSRRASQKKKNARFC
jgi:hypothetical protein